MAHRKGGARPHEETPACGRGRKNRRLGHARPQLKDLVPPHRKVELNRRRGQVHGCWGPSHNLEAAEPAPARMGRLGVSRPGPQTARGDIIRRQHPPVPGLLRRGRRRAVGSGVGRRTRRPTIAAGVVCRADRGPRDQGWRPPPAGAYACRIRTHPLPRVS